MEQSPEVNGRPNIGFYIQRRKMSVYINILIFLMASILDSVNGILKYIAELQNYMSKEKNGKIYKDSTKKKNKKNVSFQRKNERKKENVEVKGKTKECVCGTECQKGKNELIKRIEMRMKREY